jgi:hypothetical protein
MKDIIHYQFTVYFRDGNIKYMYLEEGYKEARNFEISYQADVRVLKVIRTFVDKCQIPCSQMKKRTNSKSNRLTYFIDHKNLIPVSYK